jgi:hypothetical protein
LEAEVSRRHYHKAAMLIISSDLVVYGQASSVLQYAEGAEKITQLDSSLQRIAHSLCTETLFKPLWIF